MLEYLTIENLLAAVGAIVLVANTAVLVIDKATDIKPSDRADKLAGRIRRYVAAVESVLEKFSTYKAKQ